MFCQVRQPELPDSLTRTAHYPPAYLATVCGLAVLTGRISRTANNMGYGIMTRTRFKELAFVNNGDHWRFVDTSSGSTVGQLYKTKTELLADLDRYAHNFGCDGAFDPQQHKINALQNALHCLLGIGQVAANIYRDRGETIIQAEYQRRVDAARAVLEETMA